MRTGIEIEQGVFVPYRRVLYIRKCAIGYEVTLNNGEKLKFSDAKAYQRIKNYVITGHPTLDDGPRPV